MEANGLDIWGAGRQQVVCYPEIALGLVEPLLHELGFNVLRSPYR